MPRPDRRATPARVRTLAVAAVLTLAAAPTVVAPALIPPAASVPADYPGAPAPATTAATSLDDALAAVGTDRGRFHRQVDVAERLTSLGADLGARFPAAYGGVRLTGTTGEVGFVPGAPDSDALTDAARSAGFGTYPASRPQAEVAETVRRVDDWATGLTAPERASVLTVDVAPASGEVTVIVADGPGAPRVPGELGASVHRSGFRPAQSAGSSGASMGGGGGLGGGVLDPLPDTTTTPAPTTTTTTPTPTTVTAPPVSGPGTVDGQLLGGDRYLAVQDGTSGQANWCSFGFNGDLQGTPVNITAAHCSEYGGFGQFRAGTVSEGWDLPRLGTFTPERADTALDAALITVDDSARPRLAHNLVHSAGTTPLRITGTLEAVAGLTVCKYGFRSGYTCGTSRGVAPSLPGLGDTASKILVDICGLTGDSGGVIVAGDRAVAVTSESNAFYFDATTGRYTTYANCALAGSGMAAEGQTPQLIGIAVGPILQRFPGLTLRTS